MLVLSILIVPVMASSSDYVNKYTDTPANPTQETGLLIGSIRCGMNTFTHEIGIRNIIAVNQSYTMTPIQPDGKFSVDLIPGNFSLYLPDGNAGFPEYSTATIKAGQISYPESELLGHAVTEFVPEVAPAPSLNIKVCSAVYIPDEFKCTIKNDKGKCYPVNWGQTIVTSKVQQLVNAVSSFTVTDDVLGDPAYGWKKRLDVIYVTGDGSCKHFKDLRFATAPEWTNYNEGVHGVINFNTLITPA